jgi:hypothetical protein
MLKYPNADADVDADSDRWQKRWRQRKSVRDEMSVDGTGAIRRRAKRPKHKREIRKSDACTGYETAIAKRKRLKQA